MIEPGIDQISGLPRFGLNAAAIDRLTLNPKRVAAMGEGLRQVAALPDPVGETIESTVRPNGLRVSRVRVPLGVVFFIFVRAAAKSSGMCVHLLTFVEMLEAIL